MVCADEPPSVIINGLIWVPAGPKMWMPNGHAFSDTGVFCAVYVQVIPYVPWVPPQSAELFLRLIAETAAASGATLKTPAA